MNSIPIQDPNRSDEEPRNGLILVLCSLPYGKQTKERTRKSDSVIRRTGKWLARNPLFVNHAGSRVPILVDGYFGKPFEIFHRVTDRLKAWPTNGFYYQAGFVSPEFWRNELSQPIAAGTMTVYDELVDFTGLIDPVEIRRETDTIFPSRHFWELLDFGHCIWSVELVDLRNKALVGAKAIELGLDPDAEYERFINAGGKYFLEYPELCL